MTARFHNPFRLFRMVILGLTASALSGCGLGGNPHAPRADEARAALETALSAWRDGQSSESIQAKPPVHIVDSAWRNGERIQKYEILQEEEGDDGTKVFSVRLSSSKPPGDKDAVYVVHGRDPIWVYREEDYNRMLQMDNNPAKPRVRVGKRSPRA